LASFIHRIEDLVRIIRALLAEWNGHGVALPAVGFGIKKWD